MPRGIPKNPTAGLIGVLSTRRKKLVAAAAKAQKDLDDFDKTLKVLVGGTKATGTKTKTRVKSKVGRRPGRPKAGARKATAKRVMRKRRPVNGRRRRAGRVGRPRKIIVAATKARRPGRPAGRRRSGKITQTEAIRRVLASSRRTKVGDLVNAVNSRFNLKMKTSSASTSLSLMKRAGQVRNDKQGWFLLNPA